MWYNIVNIEQKEMFIMKTIGEIQSELRKLCQELEALKQEQEAKVNEVDLKKISAVASRYPIENHPMLNEDEHHKDLYS